MVDVVHARSLYDWSLHKVTHRGLDFACWPSRIHRISITQPPVSLDRADRKSAENWYLLNHWNCTFEMCSIPIKGVLCFQEITAHLRWIVWLLHKALRPWLLVGGTSSKNGMKVVNIFLSNMFLGAFIYLQKLHEISDPWWSLLLSMKWQYWVDYGLLLQNCRSS